MKISKQQLKRIIKEEIAVALNEQTESPRFKAYLSGDVNNIFIKDRCKPAKNCLRFFQVAFKALLKAAGLQQTDIKDPYLYNLLSFAAEGIIEDLEAGKINNFRTAMTKGKAIALTKQPGRTGHESENLAGAVDAHRAKQGVAKGPSPEQRAKMAQQRRSMRMSKDLDKMGVARLSPEDAKALGGRGGEMVSLDQLRHMR